MKVTYKKRKVFYPFCFILSVVLSVICFSAWKSPAGNFVSGAVNVMVSPLQYVSDTIARGAGELSGYFADRKELSEENKHLKAEIQKLIHTQAQNEQLRAQNEELYGYLGLKRDRVDFELCNARIIARTSSNYYESFTIDKGTFHGVESNMPIINSDGVLLGVVLSADPTSSKCVSVISYDVNVGVYNERTGTTGFLGGEYSLFAKGLCSVKNLPSGTDIQKGDRILTSGVGEVYPRGLIIGSVSDIAPDMDSYTLSAVVTPDALQTGVESIMVITDFQRVYE